MSSTQVGSIHYELGLDTSKFDKAAAGVSSKMQAIGSKMSSAGKTMTLGLTLPIVAGFGLAVKAASDYNETLNKVDVAFKSQAKNVKKWASTSLKSMGLAKASALDAAALYGDMSTAMGLNVKQAAKMSMGLTELGADLASFKNISFERAQVALAGVYTGETEALKGLGIVMTEANLEAFAQSKGIKENMKDMTQAEKVQLRYAYVMKVTKNAQGDFARTFSGTANQIRYTQERVKELSAEFGQRLLPITGQILDKFNRLLTKFSELSPKQQDMIIKFGLVAAAAGPLLWILGGLVSTVGKLVGAVKGLAVLFTNPVFLVIAAVLAVVAGVAYLVYRNWDKIRPVVQGVVDKLKLAWAWFSINLLPTLKLVAAVIAGQFAAAWRDLKAAFNDMMIALRPYMPQLRQAAKVMAIVAAVILGTFVAAIVVGVTALAGMIAMLARVIGWFAKASGAVARASGSIISSLTSLQGKVVGALAGAASWLFDAGVAIVEGLANGIKSRVMAPVDAIGGVLKKARDLLPFSPAKEGPFSGKGWTLYSGQSMMKGLAQGINKTSGLPRKAMESALAGAAFKANITPTSSQSLGDNSVRVYGNININGGQSSSKVVEMLNRNQTLAGLGLATKGVGNA